MNLSVLKEDSFELGDFSTIQNLKKGIRKEIELDDFDVVFDVPCWYRIIENNICLDVFLYLRNSNKICFFGQDALIESRKELPYFYRTKWHSHFDCSLITFNDPTLYRFRGIECGWWQLEGAFELAQRFIKKIIEKMNIAQKNILFYGASCGGFFTLANISEFQDAKFIVDIAQTELYSAPFYDNINKLELLLNEDIFGHLPQDNTKRELKHIFDFWTKDIPLHVKNVTYLQNINDTKHTRTQLSFFLRKISEYLTQDNNIFNLNIQFYEGDPNMRGHSPMSEQETIGLIQEHLK